MRLWMTYMGHGTVSEMLYRLRQEMLVDRKRVEEYKTTRTPRRKEKNSNLSLSFSRRKTRSSLSSLAFSLASYAASSCVWHRQGSREFPSQLVSKTRKGGMSTRLRSCFCAASEHLPDFQAVGILHLDCLASLPPEFLDCNHFLLVILSLFILCAVPPRHR